MRTLDVVQTSWTAGEIDPRLSARIDVAKYFTAAARLRNVLALPQGGVRRRPGFRHVADLPAAALGGLRLIPFAFSVAQTFVVAVYAGGFRIWRSDGTQVFNGTGAPWTAAQAWEMNWAQSLDTLILLHRDLPPWRIRRDGSDTAWSSSALTLTNIPNHDFGAGPEPVISAARGWPECGCFHQGRFWLGGLRSRPATLLASKAGQLFDFGLGTADDDGMMLTIEGDGLNRIHQVVSGKALLVFTAGSEHAILVEPPITPTNVAISLQSTRGIRRFCRVAEIDNTHLFVQRGGAALRLFVYDEIEQSYRSDPLSLLAPHLIRAPRDVVMRAAAVQDDADVALLPDTDGAGLTVLTTLRSQEVAGFARWTIDGLVRGAAVLADGVTFLAVERDGQVRLLAWDEEALTDHGARFAFASAVSSVSGLTHLAGRTAQLVLDGRPEGQVEVPASGVVTLPRRAKTVEVGLGFPVELTTLPLEPRDPAGALIARRARLVRIGVRYWRSGPFDVQGRPQNLRRLGGPPAPPLDDDPPPEFEPASGEVVLHGVRGWRRQATVHIAQPATRPAPLTVQAITVRVAPGD